MEYLIIDGASDDGTHEIIEKYRDKIDLFISEPDSGIYNAMNKALSKATGDVVCFMNGDDYFLYDYSVESVIGEFSEDIDIVIGRSKNEVGLSEIINLNGDKSPYYEIAFPHQATFSKLSIYNKIGIFDESYSISADYEWILRAIYNNTRIKCVDVPVSYYSFGGRSDSIQCLVDMYNISKKYLCYTGKKNQIENMRAYYVRLFRNKLLEFALSDCFSEKHFKDKLNNMFYGRRCMIWGAGFWGRRFSTFFINNGISVSGFIDSNADEKSKKVNDIPVGCFYEMEPRFPIVVSIEKIPESIEKILKNSGYSYKRDYYVHDDIRSLVIREYLSKQNDIAEVLGQAGFTTEEME